MLPEKSDMKTRYALEWYVKERDLFYWRLSKKAIRKVAILAITSMAVGIAGATLAIIALMMICRIQ